MKRIACIATVVLLAGLGGGLYLLGTYSDPSEEPARWLSQSLEDVGAIHISQPSGDYSLLADDSGWKADVAGASGDVKAHVKSNRVQEYLSVLAGLQPVRYETDAVRDRLGNPGLSTADVTISINSSGESDRALVLKFSADGTGRMLGWHSRNPEMVYVFEAKELGRLALPASHFLDDYIFRFDEQLVDRVQLIQPLGSSWLVEKRESGFVFRLPGYLEGKEASGSDLKLYIHSLALMRAKQLILDTFDVEKYTPGPTLRVWIKGGKVHSVDFYSQEGTPDAYIGVSSWLTMPFLVDAGSVAQVVKSAFDVQSRTVMALDIGMVNRIVVDHGEARFVHQRSDNGWRLHGAENDTPGIDMLLWRVTNVKFEALPLNSVPKSAVPLMTCRMLDADGRLMKAMTFYADPELPPGQCWMKSEDGMYYPVSSRLLKDMQGMFPASGAR